MSLDYEQSGVDYAPLDAFKRLCQEYARTTVGGLSSRSDITEPAHIRGDSAYLIETPEEFLAHVEEGLGTKNLVADAVYRATGQSFYANIGIDLVATIVNDLITCGADPLVLAMHAAAGDAAFFSDQTVARDLAAGFAEGCRRAGAVWGGGETPALPGIVDRDTLVLAGSALGRINPKSRRITADIQPGDAIILLASNGIQTNGLTLCRALAQRLPQAYATPLPDGRTFGQTLLDPSAIYADFTRAAADIPLHYAIHITGHGWRKLMRAEPPFVYRIHDVGTPHPIFPFIAQHAGLDPRQMYATFNMGAGFAVIVRPGDAQRCIAAAQSSGHKAWQAGQVVQDGSRKAVQIVPLSIEFEESSLRLR